jgi:hypothetical protein
MYIMTASSDLEVVHMEVEGHPRFTLVVDETNGLNFDFVRSMCNSSP